MAFKVCWNRHIGRSWKKCGLEGSTCCCKISVNFFCINAAITEVEMSLIPSHSLAFGLVADNNLDAPFAPWSGAHGVHFFQQRSGIPIGLTHSMRYHRVMVHPRCLRAQRSGRRLWTRLTSGFFST